MTGSGVDALVRDARAANERGRSSVIEAAGKAIALLIDEHGWSYDDVVTRTGVSKGSVGRWSEPYRARRQNMGESQ